MDVPPTVDQDVLIAIGASIIAASVFALLARVIRQPLILGYIVAGGVLGPHIGLGVVTHDASIEFISELGLILLLFIIGLEISLPSIIQTGRTIVVSGLLQFPISVGLAWLVFGPLTAATGGAYDRLYLATALSLSSTLIVVKLLYDKLEMATLAGRITLGILIFQDLWAIAFLALQPSLHALRPVPLLASLGSGVGLVATAVVLSRLALPRLFRAVARSPELILITAIAWCFLVAGTAGHLGLSKEMGALIAGMVIAAFPYGVEVVTRLSGVRDFFLTLFFVALGMKMPVPSTRLLLLTAALAVFVAASRILVMFPIFMLLRLDTRTAGVVGINLAQISEFSLVIVSLGLAYHHVSQEIASLVLYTLLFTAVAATYAILFNHAIATTVSSISDWFLKGTDNFRLLRQVRAMAPRARVIVTADTLAAAERLYAEGADYVLVPPALAAEHLYELLAPSGPQALAEARQRQAAALGKSGVRPGRRKEAGPPPGQPGAV